MCACVDGGGVAVRACLHAWHCVALRLLCHAPIAFTFFRLVQDNPGPGDPVLHRLSRVRCAGHHLHLRPLDQQVRHAAPHYHYRGCRR